MKALPPQINTQTAIADMLIEARLDSRSNLMDDRLRQVRSVDNHRRGLCVTPMGNRRITM